MEKEVKELYPVPRVELSELLGESPPDFLTSKPLPSLLPKPDLHAFLGLLVKHKPLCVLEVGTHDGSLTNQIAANLVPNVGVYTIGDGRLTGKAWKGTGLEGYIYSINRNHSPSWRQRLHIKNVKPNLIFLNGPCSFSEVMHDSDACFSMIPEHENCIFLWNHCDPEHPNVVELIMRWRKLGRDIQNIRGTSLALWMKASSGNPATSDV